LKFFISCWVNFEIVVERHVTVFFFGSVNSLIFSDCSFFFDNILSLRNIYQSKIAFSFRFAKVVLEKQKNLHFFYLQQVLRFLPFCGGKKKEKTFSFYLLHVRAGCVFEQRVKQDIFFFKTARVFNTLHPFWTFYLIAVMAFCCFFWKLGAHQNLCDVICPYLKIVIFRCAIFCGIQQKSRYSIKVLVKQKRRHFPSFQHVIKHPKNVLFKGGGFLFPGISYLARLWGVFLKKWA